MTSKTHHIREISVRYEKKLVNQKGIRSSLDAAATAREIYAHTESHIELKEYFFCIFLNRANHVTGYYKLSEGGICGTVVDQRLLFATALKCLATGIVLVHNHPSGNLTPSEHDRELTKKIRSAAQLLDITILDHIILTSDSYYSFEDNGI
jgi:DNA repair protein RadC